MNNRRCYSWRLKAFGLTEEEYENMVKLQDGSCAICLKPETYLHKGVLQNLAIDHDHNTGKVRALLCAKCNKGIGIFNENTETMKSAIRYIEFHKESSN